MTHGDESSSDARMGIAVLRGVTIGIPVAIVGLTVAVWLITRMDLADSFATAFLPGVLLGGFAGGFVGLTRSME